MAIQMRRGEYADFYPSKMVAGEFAVVMSGDPDASAGRAVYICFEPGVVKRMVTVEDFEAYFDELADEFKAEFTEEIQAAIKDALEATEAANEAAQKALDTVDEVVQIAEQGAADAKEIAEQAGAEAKEIAEQAGAEAKEEATKIAEEAGEEAKQIAESAAETASKAAEAADEATTNADSAADLARAAAGSGVMETLIEYAASDSGVEPPEEGWQETPPEVQEGSFLWTRVTLLLNSGDKTVFYSVGKMGTTGGIRFTYDADDKNITITY